TALVLRLSLLWDTMTRDIVALLLVLGLTGSAFAGYDEGTAAFKRGDYATALKEWQPRADKGDPAAEDGLGTLYRNGTGVSRNYPEALKWYRKASDQGFAAAQYNIGSMYAEGDGVPQDYTKAMLWYRKAAAQGWADAEKDIGVLYAEGDGVHQNYAEAM